MTYNDYLDLQEKRKDDCWEEYNFDLTFVMQFMKDGKMDFDFVDAYDTDEAFDKTYYKHKLNWYNIQIIGIFDDYEMNPTTFDGRDVNEL